VLANGEPSSRLPGGHAYGVPRAGAMDRPASNRGLSWPATVTSSLMRCPGDISSDRVFNG
jgi:hypothetical protein